MVAHRKPTALKRAQEKALPGFSRATPAAASSLDGQCPVAAFVQGSNRLGTTRSTPRLHHCLAAQPHRPKGRVPTHSTLPLCRVSNTSPTSEAPGHDPGIYRASQISVWCQSNGHVARAQGAPSAWKYVRLFPASAVAFPHLRRVFRGQNLQAPSYPLPARFAIRHRLHRNVLASPCGPFIVELFAAPDLPRTPRRVTAPTDPCRQVQAPYARQVVRAPMGTSPLAQTSSPLHQSQPRAFQPTVFLCRPGPLNIG